MPLPKPIEYGWLALSFRDVSRGNKSNVPYLWYNASILTPQGGLTAISRGDRWIVRFSDGSRVIYTRK